MANRFPAFQWYVKDWLSSKARLLMTLEAQGAYFNLLNHYWDGNCAGLPTDYRQLATLAGIKGGEDKENEILKQILLPLAKKVPPCLRGKGQVLHNKRLLSDFKNLVKLSKARSKAGSMGGRPEKQDESKTKANAKQNGGLHLQSSSSSSSSSEDLNIKAAPKLKSGSPEALIAAEYVRTNPGIIGIEKATPIVAFYLNRGADAGKAKEAVNDQASKGRLLWEILEVLCPEPAGGKGSRKRGDVHDEVKRILAGRTG